MKSLCAFFLALITTSVFAQSSGHYTRYPPNNSVNLPVAVAEGGTGAITAAGARANLSAAESGANSDITSLSEIDQTGIVFHDGASNTVTLIAPATVTGSYSFIFPATICSSTQVMISDGLGGWTCGSPGISNAAFAAYVANSIPAKDPAFSLATSNLALTGNPGTVNGYDFTFGGTLLLNAQTDDTENGLWSVDTNGPWTRNPSMPDNTTSCLSAIVPVENFGSTFANTIWFSTCDGSGSVHFVQLATTGSRTKVISQMGACTVASTTLSTTATNETCAGMPASSGVAVSCSGSAAFSTPTAGGIYCRATGTANQIACNTAVANTQAMTFTCQWMTP